MEATNQPLEGSERIECSIAAAIHYDIPANLLLAVAQQEGGKPGQWVRNKNGTHDVGTMQFNTAYLAQLARYGIRPEHVASPGCYPYQLAAWRLKEHLAHDLGTIWQRAANYHSRTPLYNERYAYALALKAQQWAKWLSEHYPTSVYELKADQALGADSILSQQDQK